MGLVVTTSERPRATQRARAAGVAARCGVAYVPRRGGLDALLRASGAEVAYVVGRRIESLTDGRERIAVHAGLTRTRLRAGDAHPLLRAVAPRGRGSVRRVFDGTLGLAQDALHLAAALDADVVGTEASPVVYALLEEGLPRLAREVDAAVACAAARVRAIPGACADVLAEVPAQAYDAVYLSPMFVAPRGAPPGYELFRAIAVHDALDARTVARALRAAPRLVVKGLAGDPPPEALRHYDPICVPGKAVDFWVVVGDPAA